MSLQYSIIIPTFNGQNSIEMLFEEITKFFKSTNYTYEVIIVDDGNTNNTWDILTKLKNNNKNVKIIRLTKNFGQQPATLCGIKFAAGKYIITIDDDLEVHPEEIKHLIAEQEKSGNDVVYGEYRKIKQSFIREFLTNVYKASSKMEGKNKGKGSSLRLIKSELAHKLAETHTHFMFIDELLLWYTNRMSFIKVKPNKSPVEKRSGYSLGSLFKITGSVIMFSSTFPLRFVTTIGFSLATVNFLIGTYYLLKKFLFKIPVHGYTSIIVSVLFSTGLIVLSIGVVAQYISRILKDVNNKPSYYIAEKSVDD